MSEDSRGLTAQYGNWLESKTALKYVLGNLLAYLLVAIIGYSFVFENWKIHDSVYFAVVVFTTVGKPHDKEAEVKSATPLNMTMVRKGVHSHNIRHLLSLDRLR